MDAEHAARKAQLAQQIHAQKAQIAAAAAAAAKPAAADAAKPAAADAAEPAAAAGGGDDDESDWDDAIIGARLENARRLVVPSEERPPQQLDPATDGEAFVGRRISVLWLGNNGTWFDGYVASYAAKRPDGCGGRVRHRFKVEYDDGDEKKHYFAEKKEKDLWQLLPDLEGCPYETWRGMTIKARMKLGKQARTQMQREQGKRKRGA